MYFAIRHTTRFTYDRPVFLEPHTLRLRPRSDGLQRLLRFDLDASPQPAGCSQCLELDGNVAVRPWFEGVHGSLTVTVESEVETADRSPFDFLLDPAALRLPLDLGGSVASPLAPYRTPLVPAGEVADLARRVADECDGATLPFLGSLNTRIHETCAQVFRAEGDPLSPEDTWRSRQGACRDLTVLFMEGCRHLGIPARFVSGYQPDPPDQEQLHLHAWAEVYLPGAGWRGYDPSRGLSVAGRHVALAAGPTHELARPVEGSFRGNDVDSRMDVRISIRTSAAAPGDVESGVREPAGPAD